MSLPHTAPSRSTGLPVPSPTLLVEDRVSLLGIASTLLRHRGLVLGLALLAAGGFVTRALIFSRTYTTQSSFLPQTNAAPPNLSGLVAQFGLALPISSGAPGPAFYADLITSRQILGAVVDTPFTVGPGQTPASLAEIYRSSGKTAALRREAAMRELEGNLSVIVDQKTGTVKLQATATEPRLARLLNQRILNLLNEFNLHTRQSQAAQERRFTEQRLAEIRQELRAAEDRQQAFLQRNREFRNSPELAFQAERLAREVSMRQELFTTLAQAYEQAKIEEVRDTPVITVVERPELPVRPDPRGLIKWGIVALLAGGVVGAVLAFMLDSLRRSRAEEVAEFTEFDELRRRAVDDVLHPWRPVRRWLQARQLSTR